MTNHNDTLTSILTIITILSIAYIFIFSKGNFIRNFFSKTIGKGIEKLNLSKKTSENMPSIILTSIILLLTAGSGFLGIGLGIIIIGYVIINTFWSKPDITWLYTYPKAYFEPSFERYLKALAVEYGINEDIQIRISGTEGFNAFAAQGYYLGKKLNYIVIGKGLLDFVKEFDKPDNINKERKTLFEFVYCHELEHIKNNDIITKFNAIKFLQPVTKLNMALEKVKTKTISLKNGIYDMKGESNKSNKNIFIKLLFGTLQAPLLSLYYFLLIPISNLEQKAEFNADFKAYNFLKNRNTKELDNGVALLFLHLIESGFSNVRSTVTEAIYQSHPPAYERALKLGIDIFKNRNSSFENQE